MVQFNFVMSITIVALLIAPVISMPLPSQTWDVEERDTTAVLQRRQFASLFKFIFNIGKLIAKGISKLKHLHHHHHHSSVSKTVHHALSNNNSTSVPHIHKSKHRRRKREMFDMEERSGWDDHDDLNTRELNLDELD